MLGVAFALLTLHAWVGYRERPSAARYLLAALAFAAALASKVMVMTLPVALLVLELTVLRASTARTRLGRLVLEKLPLLAMALAAALAVAFRQQREGAVATLNQVSLSDRLVAVPWWLTRYVGKTLWPTELCVMYPRVAVSSLEVVAGLVVVGGLTGLAFWRARRGQPGPLIGWALFVLTLTPVLGLLQTGEQAIADRYTHLGHLALFAGLVSAVPLEAFTRRAFLLAASGTTLLLFVISLAQLQTWRDTDSVFARALEVEPVNPFISRQIDGLPLEVMLAEGRVSEAQSEATRLVQKWPADARVMILAGTAAAQGGDYPVAIERFLKALALEPGNEDAERFLGYAKEDARRK
jgi:tetratricopeptide (TPR) repeat protein